MEDIPKKSRVYPRDKNLVISFYGTISESDITSELEVGPSEEQVTTSGALSYIPNYPSLKDFAFFARASYIIGEYRIYRSSSQEHTHLQDKQPGFEVFAVAHKAINTTGGFIGVAFINRQKRQIVISYGDVDENSESAYSAMTFAYEIAKLIEKLEGWVVFFTGYFQAGWLAQIACFSTNFLTIAEDTYFTPHKHLKRMCPYTVVFQATCAADFLNDLKSALFVERFAVTNDIELCLPVEMFTLESCKLHLNQNFHSDYGTLFLLKDKGTPSKYSTVESIVKIHNLLFHSTESDSVIGEVSRIKTTRSSCNRMYTNTIPWNPIRFIVNRYFSLKEISFIKIAQYRYEEGQFEGLNYKDEVLAGKMMNKLKWNLGCREIDELLFLECYEMTRQQFIPRMKRVFMSWQQASLWFNRSKGELPQFFVERTWKTTNTVANGPYSEYFTAKRLAKQIDSKLILLADFSGTGKSVALTELELVLRRIVHTRRIICRRDMNDIVSRIKDNQLNEHGFIFSVISSSSPFITEEAVLALQAKCGDISLYLLIDALDSVPPESQGLMIKIIQTLVSGKDNETLSPFRLRSIVLVTRRTNVKNLVETQFPVETFSLRPITIREQSRFLGRKVQSEKYAKDIKTNHQGLPFLYERMCNPLLLTTYCEYIKRHYLKRDICCTKDDKNDEDIGNVSQSKKEHELQNSLTSPSRKFERKCDSDQSNISQEKPLSSLMREQDSEDIRTFIRSNLVELTKSTVIGAELVVMLTECRLIDEEQMDLLMDSRTPNIRRSTLLYTVAANKWDDAQIEEFLKILKFTFSNRALRVFSYGGWESALSTEDNELLEEREYLKAGDPKQMISASEIEEQEEDILSSDEMELFLQLKDKHQCGAFEGLCLKDEILAGRVLKTARECSLNTNGTFEIELNVQRKEVRQFVETLKKGMIWWNDYKPQMPNNYIPRRVCKTEELYYFDGTLRSAAATTTLLEVKEDFVLLVDSAGSGKTCELTDFEQIARRLYCENRVVVHINLNLFREEVGNISCESVSSVLIKLAPFVPWNKLEVSNIHVFLLVDGIDEVSHAQQDSIFNLLRILGNADEREADLRRKLRVILTTRPHVREKVESEFKTKSWSLVPLSREEQKDYIKSEMGLSKKETTQLKNKIPPTLKSLLDNPHMLSILIETIKSKEISSFSDVNVYVLFSFLLKQLHQRHLVEKKKMRAEDTDISVKKILAQILPFYFHVAWNQLLRGNAEDTRKNKLPLSFTESIRIVAKEPPSFVRSELLSCGLLVERGAAKRLFFKHRSFAEFFYARLLLLPQTPQGVRDTLFGFIYKPTNHLENVEEFVGAALSKRSTQANLHLTPKLIVDMENRDWMSCLLVNFVGAKLFPFVVRQLLTALVEEDPRNVETFCAVVGRRSRGAFVRLVGWMSAESEWSRGLFLKKQDNSTAAIRPSAARLIVAIALKVEGQNIFSEEEVQKAILSLKWPLSTVSLIQTDKVDKWEWVERISGETVEFRKLNQTADSADLSCLTLDVEGTWKLFSTFFREELFSLFVNEETRRTDLIGWWPLGALMALGEEFVPHVADFRGKFGDNRGKTVFELSKLGRAFGLEFLWADLHKEMEERRVGGVSAALREAIGRSSNPQLLLLLEEGIRRRRSCPRDQSEAHLIEWVVDGGRLWDSLSSFPLGMLPFVIRYSASASQVGKFFEQNKEKVEVDEESVFVLLRSLILSCRHDNPTWIPQLKATLSSSPPKWASLTQVFVEATEAELKAAIQPLSPSLVSDVSVGGVFLALTENSTESVDAPWTEIVGDVIIHSPCCNFPVTLKRLLKLPAKKLRNILTDEDVLLQWNQRVCQVSRRNGGDYTCALRNLLSFYFDVFGLNLEWMERPDGSPLLKSLPVEIATTLAGHLPWTHLVPQFRHSVKSFFRDSNIKSVNEVAGSCYYETEEEWEMFFGMLRGEEFLQSEEPTNSEMHCTSAAPFICALMKYFGVEETRRRVATLWGQIPSNLYFPTDSIETIAGVLHCAVELGELEEVRRRAFPGLLSWRNPQGKVALDVAMVKWGENHPITQLLLTRSETLRKNLQ